MSTKNQRKSRSVRIKAALDKHLENIAKLENRSVNNLIETLLAKASDFREPNEETKQSIEEAIRKSLFRSEMTTWMSSLRIWLNDEL